MICRILEAMFACLWKTTEVRVFTSYTCDIKRVGRLTGRTKVYKNHEWVLEPA